MSDVKTKILSLLDDEVLRDLLNPEKVRELIGDEALNKWADTCNCPKCQKRKAALASSVKDLKKKLAKYEGVYEAILSKLGLDEAKDFENVHFTFVQDGAMGSNLTFKHDGVQHTVINVDADNIAKFYLNNFEVNSTEDVRAAADEADIETVEAVVHELQHLRQSIDGRYVVKEDELNTHDGKKVCYWDGNRMAIDPKVNFPKSDEDQKVYENLPWEIDAREVAKRVTDELIASGRLPNRPTPRQEVKKRDIMADILQSIGLQPIAIAQHKNGQVVRIGGDGKPKPLTAADAEKLLAMIDAGDAKFILGESREDGKVTKFNGDTARQTLVEHLKELIGAEKPATVH
jgi:hypothetical protein